GELDRDRAGRGQRDGSVTKRFPKRTFSRRLLGSSSRAGQHRTAPMRGYTVPAAQAILKNLGWRFCSMAKLVFGLNQSLDHAISLIRKRNAVFTRARFW